MKSIKMKCLVWGTGSAWETRKYFLNYNFIEIIGFIDSDENKQEKEIEGLRIDKPENVKNYKYDLILIMSRYVNEISEQLKICEVDEKKILNTYEFMASSHSFSRNTIANQYIKYSEGYKKGIEIGGANNPIKLDNRISILQVDCCEHVDDIYAEFNLVKIDVVDDGEKLEKFEDSSLDFLVACHMIEHCINPVGTLRNFLKKVRKGGIVFLAIPDKRYTFEKERDLTAMQHLILDDKIPNLERDREHFSNKKITIEEIERCRDQHVHHHVWDDKTWMEFIKEMQKYLIEEFTVELCGNFNEYSGHEITCIIKKK